MKMNPKQFAFYLKSSSLNSVEQRAVLSRLPKMDEAAIKVLYDRLKADHEAMAQTLQSAHLKRDTLKRDFEVALNSEPES